MERMNCRKKKIISKIIPLTTKNIGKIQENFEKEMKLHEKLKTILNGRVNFDQVLENGSTFGADLEYEFMCSVSEYENADHYRYKFDAYPVAQKPQSSTTSGDSAHHKECVNSIELQDFVEKKDIEASNRQSRKQNKTASVKRERAKSAGVTRFHTQDSQTIRPKSTSLAANSKTAMTASDSDIKGRKQSSEITKEVAFRDTNSIVSKTTFRSNNKSSKYQRRKSVSYDPVLEKASAYIHGGGKNFSRSNTSLTPVKYGMKHLQMNYTETNLERNQSVIFLDLLKNSHQRSQIRSEQIQHIERRLELKRNSPLYSTSFYENKKIPDPFHRNREITTRTVAQKKIERKEKIKQMTDEIHTGYVPTKLTMRIADREEVEDIGKRCRYLRCQSFSEL